MVQNKRFNPAQVNHVLQYLYKQPTKFGSFLSGSDTLYETVRKMFPGLHVTKRTIRDFLSTQDTSTRNRQFRTHFKMQKVLTGGLKTIAPG